MFLKEVNQGKGIQSGSRDILIIRDPQSRRLKLWEVQTVNHNLDYLTGTASSVTANHSLTGSAPLCDSQSQPHRKRPSL